MVDSEDPDSETLAQFYFSRFALNGRRQLRIKCGQVQTTITWVESPAGYEELRHFASAFAQLMDSALDEIGVRDSIRDLDQEIENLFSEGDKE